ncbi:RibD family protein [Hyphomicrobium sp.]|uniref:RibD family protein n=1 Tax=Hyphomicrobium sp. TaxID=82 RepID=UPI000FB4F44A|nr:RibD family protein [Hyphomicrobium sp.]RUP10345.1 MAG: RibD family protein [Hyphomicrobium sp.]
MTSGKIDSETSLQSVFDPIVGAPPDRPFVVAQLGQSLDGRIATVSGDSQVINGPAALDHLHRLRSCVDAVVVGIGTIIADDPLLTVRRVDGPQPVRVIIDPRGRLPASARCLATGDSNCLVVTSSEAAVPKGAERLVVKSSTPRIEPGDIVHALFTRGLKRILVEGGGITISHFIDAGAVDRIHILVAPLIFGSGMPALSLLPISSVGEAIRPETSVRVLDGGDVLFDCNLRHQRRG